MMKLRMRMFVPLLGMVAVLFCAGNAFAVLGACVNCHTMHNSQDGDVMTFNGGAAAGGMLLRGSSCGGCHADATVNSSGTGIGSLSIPQVDEDEATVQMSGGTFKWVSTTHNKGHNVVDLSIAIDDGTGDATSSGLGQVPPGFDSSSANGVGDAWSTAGNQLTCAGTYGCHGDHSLTDKFDSLNGAHHSNAGNDGSTNLGGTTATVGGSYRFLKSIQGVELDSSTNWEETDSNHPVYFGSTTGTDDTTISALCAQCHGNFHIRADISSSGSSPWLRHPTDIDMAALDGSSEYALYEYNIEAPVAVTNPGTVTSSSDDSAYTTQIVTCLSCHRAHGSDHADLLRWDYNTNMTVGTTTANVVNEGCFRCHTAKDGDATQ